MKAKGAVGPCKFAVRAGLTAASADVGVVRVNAPDPSSPGTLTAELS